MYLLLYCWWKSTFLSTSSSEDDSILYFWITSSQTIFELQLLEQLTFQLLLSACSFESQAQVYNAIHALSDQWLLAHFSNDFRWSNTQKCSDGLDWMLNTTRLEDGWFLYQDYKCVSWTWDLNGYNFAQYTAWNRQDIELLCQNSHVKNFNLSS